MRLDGTTDRDVEQPRPAPAAAAGRAAPARPRRRGYASRHESRGAAILVAPYVVLLLVGGLIPAGYAIVKSLQDETGTRFGGLTSFQRVTNDFRFVDTFTNILTVMAVWLPIMMIGVVGLALLVHATPNRFGSTVRFIYYLPGALAGIANFMLWLYLLNPGQSPLDFLWRGFGYETLNEVASPGNLPVVLASMLFFQGAGTWLVVVNGGLNGISDDVLEAATLDGANAWQVAWRVKLPIIRPWLGYMALLNIAYGFQLFLEPQVLSQATHGLISPQYTPNQLSYTYAYQILDLPAAAAMSVLLLLITLVLGLLVVFRSGLFAEER
jgi:multiple sugar transport system permease protein